MTYGEFKKTEVYVNANDIEICVNGEEPIDEEYFAVDEFCMLDELLVFNFEMMINNLLHIDLYCANWNKRLEFGWVPES
jgi:hypothetical protein